jgi:uncharacterized protein
MRSGTNIFAAMALVFASAASAEPIESRTPDGATPLHQAAFSGNVADVKRLLSAGADVNATNDYGVTAMQLAADTGNAELIRLLLKAGADASSPNPEGETALHLIARTGNVDAAKLLLKAGAAVDARENFGGQTPLMWAVARRHPAMVEFLASKGADVNERSAVRDYKRVATAESRAKFLDRGGLTPLMYAARENCRACVEVLLKHEVDIDLPDPSGMAPLTLAMMNSSWDIAKRLIEAGADVNQWDQFGQSPLHVAIFNLEAPNARNPLDQDEPNAVTPREVVSLLLARGANPNQQLYYRAAGRGIGFAATGGGVGRGLTPFLMACAIGDVGVVEQLLEHGANVKLATSDAQGALILAVEFSPGDKVELINVLAAAGADVNLMAKRHFLQRSRGGSALHYAVRRGSREVMAGLIKLGIDVNAKDEDGLTALDYAMARGYVPFLQMQGKPRQDLADPLRAAGATVELAQTPDWPPQGPPIATAVYDAVIWPVDPVGP